MCSRSISRFRVLAPMADQPASPTPHIKRTPLHGAHVKLGARLTNFGGWEMPLSYEGQLAEHKAVRSGAGMFDVSHMGQVRFGGEGALGYLQQLVPADISTLKPGESRYTQLCNRKGGIID